MGDFYDYFKVLSSSYNEDNFMNDNVVTDTDIFEKLNVVTCISCSEIEDAIRKLKREKKVTDQIV